MIATDEDALICDFAEEYHIYDYTELPVQYCATLAAGLRDTSRIKAKMGGLESTLDVILLALISDNMSTLLWFQSKDGHKNVNRPPSVLSILNQKKEEKDVVGFTSVEAFEMARNRLLTGG